MIKTKFRSVLSGKSLWRRALFSAVLIPLFFVLAGAVDATKNHPNVLENIALEKTVTDSDAIWLRNDLIWLRDTMPEWYAYIVEATPFALTVDQDAGENGIAATANAATSAATEQSRAAIISVTCKYQAICLIKHLQPDGSSF